jgi:hypothetical protein
MPTCWVQAVRQPHTTATSASPAARHCPLQLRTRTPARWLRGISWCGGNHLTHLGQVAVGTWGACMSLVCPTDNRKVQGIIIRVGQANNIIAVQPVVSGLPKKNCTCLTFNSNAQRVPTLKTQYFAHTIRVFLMLRTINSPYLPTQHSPNRLSF